jgi:hypothetical protein
MFPPSSPLIGDRDDDIKPKASLSTGFAVSKPTMADRGRLEYPTPNPSSCLFRLSSPANDHRVTINRDFNILAPDAGVLRVPLISHKSNLTIGRSSKSCDFFFGSKDKMVSREHVSVTYDASNIVLTCLGANGMAITIPKSCYVYATNTPNNYIIRQSEAALSMNDSLKKCHKSIKLSSNYTGFTVNRNETITLPRFFNILIEINNHVILINPEDEEEEMTDDETPTLVSSTPIKPVVNDVTPQTPAKSTSCARMVSDMNHDSTPSKQSEIVKPIESQSQVQLQPQSQQRNLETSLSAAVKIANPVEIFKDKVSKSQSSPNSPVKSKPQTHPLQDKTNNFNAVKRKAQSEEPPKIRKKQKSENHTVTPEDEKIEDTSTISAMNPDVVLKDVSNVSEVSNILVNHLAFSRLSSTPASFLNTISAITSKLSLKQIRVLLHNIECVGVIEREGKDAAGKPLQEEYYYLPEKDTDAQRTTLVAQIKGHGGLRACRRTHKQYYWKKPAPIKK